mgnify:CR=1 FL=1
MLNRGIAICGMGLFSGIESAKSAPPSGDCYFGNVSITIRFIADTFEPAFIVAKLAAVPSVLRIGGQPKIVEPIIGRIAIFVIDGADGVKSIDHLPDQSMGEIGLITNDDRRITATPDRVRSAVVFAEKVACLRIVAK